MKLLLIPLAEKNESLVLQEAHEKKHKVMNPIL
jgi:hypothetical protein